MKFKVFKKLNFYRISFIIMLVSVIFIVIQFLSLKSLIKTENLAETNEVPKNNVQIDIQNLTVPLGVHYNEAYLYQPDKEGYFTCIKTKERIKYDHVNDDYCDCDDGSDEPATSACPESKFYCKTQFDNDDGQNHFVPSSRVNDGICDCCDASDEYNTNLSCKKTCEDKQREIIKKREVKNLAEEAKKDYIEAGLGKNTNLYGPQGIFFKLSQKCFKFKSGEFDYDVCPYKKITQKSRNTVNLGSQPHLTNEKSKWILSMSSGDSSLCSKPRSSKIIFDCEIEEKLTRVEEPEQCVYVFHMNTIAAC